MDVTKFGVDWKPNRKRRMTIEIMIGMAGTTGQENDASKKKVLLFLDNATSHPDIKLRQCQGPCVFFHPMSHPSQPLDRE
ncbi:hypothetical protein ANN_17527 [Periplaneta americana]|uniref:DDE-1 domain-containing protein n=1 Tax=Periplaneta americana TaxID=6978 RepID=A0ABQ8ST85_PERAM|nr:hypothetical protein ANN_17527 [Periplaneta americana]